MSQCGELLPPRGWKLLRLHEEDRLHLQAKMETIETANDICMHNAP